MKPIEAFGLDSYLEPSTNYDSESEHSEQLTHSRSRMLAREATFGYFKDASREDPCTILPQHPAIHGLCLHKYLNISICYDSCMTCMNVLGANQTLTQTPQNVNCFKFSTFQWISLMPTDRHVLSSTDK